MGRAAGSGSPKIKQDKTAAIFLIEPLNHSAFGGCIRVSEGGCGCSLILRGGGKRECSVRA
jgi:hypothetical protein